MVPSYGAGGDGGGGVLVVKEGGGGVAARVLLATTRPTIFGPGTRHEPTLATFLQSDLLTLLHLKTINRY